MATVLEPTIDRGPAPESSDRSFGFVFAVVFCIIGCWPLLYGEPLRWWALAVAAVFAVLALIRPQLLHLLNLAWLAFGRLLHRIVSPLVMGMLFFAAVTPTGWLMRLRGRDILSLKRRPELKTYWIRREPESQPAPETMKNQF
jgi:Saxitoxin biosynthesis operon protein SxtJ